MDVIIQLTKIPNDIQAPFIILYWLLPYSDIVTVGEFVFFPDSMQNKYLLLLFSC